jgi:nucleoside-diphosphate-sugar epimerase
MMAQGAILVTGAAGFIGSRLVERLRRDGRVVHVLLRDGTKADQLRALDCHVFRGDVTLQQSIAPALTGCSTVVHCAVGGTDMAQARAINVEGTLNVLTAAAEAGARRIVHVSSVVAHGRRWPPVLNEDLPLQLEGDPYAVTKAESEQVATAFARSSGLELTIVRPTIVWGPGSARILLDLDRVRLERVKLIGDGRGLLNLVYIDDLIDGLVLAASAPAAANEAFLMSGQTATSCREYFTTLAAMCRKPPPPSLRVWRARAEALWSTWHFRFTRHPRRIEDSDFSLMNQFSTVSSAKAERLLGFTARVSFAEGMRRTESWLRERGYLPGEMAAKAA